VSNQERSQNDQSQAKSDDSINTKDFLIGALIGGMVGAATALFLTPKSGKELRSNINEQALVIREKTGHLKESAMAKGSQIAAVTKDKTNSLTHSVSQQSVDLVNKVKNLKPKEEETEQSADEATGKDYNEIQRRLEETQRAFDETEGKIHQ
jgi:gas vesicle protein